MINRFMNRHSLDPAVGGSGYGCSPVDCEYRDQCDRTGEHCRHHGRNRKDTGGPESGPHRPGEDQDFGPHGPGEGRGPHKPHDHDEERAFGPHASHGHGGDHRFGPHGPNGPGEDRELGPHGRPWRPAPPEDDSLRSLLIRAAQSMHHPHAGASQELVLRILDRNSEMDQRILRQELRIQPGSLSELLGKLEQKGLIERERIEADRRRVTVRLTESGRAALSPGEAAADDPFAVLTDEEQSVLRSLLEKLLSGSPNE